MKGGINRIAVKINDFYKREVLSKTSSLSLHFDPTYAPDQHIATIAEIVGVCDDVHPRWRQFVDDIKDFDHLYFDYKALEENEVAIDKDGNKIYFVELYLVFAASKEVKGESPLVLTNTGFTLCSPFYGFGWKNIDVHGNGELTMAKENKFGMITEINPEPDNRIAYVRHADKSFELSVGDLVFREAETNYEYEIAGELVYVVRNENIDGILKCKHFAYDLTDDVRNEYENADFSAVDNRAIAKDILDDLK